nr:hypothetical protein BaRGS_006115 [Batillaria attramentaria]
MGQPFRKVCPNKMRHPFSLQWCSSQVMGGIHRGATGISVQDRLFRQYDGPDACLDANEFDQFWFGEFDHNSDGNITEQEFVTHWHDSGLRDREHAAMYFLVMDRVFDEKLDSQDLAHVFRLFDIDANGCVDQHEFDYEWRGLFGIDTSDED